MRAIRAHILPFTSVPHLLLHLLHGGTPVTCHVRGHSYGDVKPRENVLGTGKFSTVYKVTDKRTGVNRAAKVLSIKELTDEQLASIALEVCRVLGCVSVRRRVGHLAACPPVCMCVHACVRRG